MEDENLVAFAARTKDRVMQLKVEQTKLNDAKNRLQKILDLAKKESQVNNSKRRILLTTTNARNEVELEWNKVRDKISDYETLIREMQLETQQIESQAEKLEAQWKDDVERIYSPFQLEMDLYQHSLEQSIQERKERASKRFEELRQLEHRAQVLNEREGNLRRECRTLESEIERFQIAEKAGDEEVSSLATQIQEALAKRTKLRRSLREVTVESRE